MVACEDGSVAAVLSDCPAHRADRFVGLRAVIFMGSCNLMGLTAKEFTCFVGAAVADMVLGIVDSCRASECVELREDSQDFQCWFHVGSRRTELPKRPGPNS